MPTVLVVDDDETTRTLLVRLLVRGNYKVLTAKDGRQAVTTARTERPDLILMDLEMPEIDGWNATAQLKMDLETERIPILVLSGNTEPNAHHQALAAGGDDFENKPVQFSRLKEKMDRLLAKHE